MKKPIIVVNRDSEEGFEDIARELIMDGYELASSTCSVFGPEGCRVLYQGVFKYEFKESYWLARYRPESGCWIPVSNPVRMYSLIDALKIPGEAGLRLRGGIDGTYEWDVESESWKEVEL